MGSSKEYEASELWCPGQAGSFFLYTRTGEHYGVLVVVNFLAGETRDNKYSDRPGCARKGGKEISFCFSTISSRSFSYRHTHIHSHYRGLLKQAP
jgi:hypothetical protein